MKKYVLFVVTGLLYCIGIQAQGDAYLRKLTEGVLNIRQAKSSKTMLNNTVALWSASDCPKITLMDEMDNDEQHEYIGTGSNKFQINKVVAFVYGHQNTGMVSKGDYFNSTEKDIFYSAIEKTVLKGQTATYTLIGHVGVQEFVFISYNPKAVFTVMVNGEKAELLDDGVQWARLDRVGENDKIVFSIKNESSANESFVILNHNPQK